MRQPPSNQPRPSISDETKLTVLLVFMSLGILLLITLVALLLGGKIQIQPAQEAATIPSTSVAPTIFVPTVDCGSPSLVIGVTTYQIRNISLAPDGSASLPPQENGVAYWVQDTGSQNIFMLSPTPENLALLTSLTAGTTAKATWSNCNSMTFTLSAPQPGDLGTTGLLDLSSDSIAIFVQLDPTGEGFVVNGELTEEQISTFNTPDAGGGEVQAEIGLLETAASPDGTTISLTVSIYNYGIAPFMLSTNDISLTLPDGTPLTIVDSEPELPREISAAATETITLTFPQPQTPAVTLRIFTVEYDVEGY